MNITLLNDSFPPLIDGVSNAVYNYADVLTKNGDDITVATPWYPGVTDNYNFEVVRYNSANTVRFAGYRAGLPLKASTLSRLTEKKPHIIHSHCPVASTVLARALRETANAPIIMTYHTKFDIDIAKLIRLHSLQTTAIKYLCSNISSCDEVWVVSRGAGENLRSIGYEGDYIVMENGVDLPCGRVADEKINAVRNEFSLPDGVPVFIFVGRLMWYKGVRIILESLAGLKAEGIDYRMLFIGDGKDREEIQALTEELKIYDKVSFAGAVRDREVLRSFFCTADLFLFPSTFDTNGLVVREAAACALPSVLIEGSCAAEGVEDGVTGYLSEENTQAFTEKLKEILKNRELIKKVGENAQNNIYISWEDSIMRARERYEIVYENYLSNKTVHPRIRSDEFFELIGRLQSQVEKIHSKYMEIGARRKKMEENFTNFIDRYM